MTHMKNNRVYSRQPQEISLQMTLVCAGMSVCSFRGDRVRSSAGPGQQHDQEEGAFWVTVSDGRIWAQDVGDKHVSRSGHSGSNQVFF